MAEVISLLRYIAFIIQYLGVIFVIFGAGLALVELTSKRNISLLRRSFAEKILLGLEFIIAADIILATVVFAQEDLLKLGAVVIIRILLGYSLKHELS